MTTSALAAPSPPIAAFGLRDAYSARRCRHIWLLLLFFSSASLRPNRWRASAWRSLPPLRETLYPTAFPFPFPVTRHTRLVCVGHSLPLRDAPKRWKTRWARSRRSLFFLGVLLESAKRLSRFRFRLRRCLKVVPILIADDASPPFFSPPSASLFVARGRV